MKLLNFSVGRVQTISIGSQPVQTAHVKAPAAEPWVITPDGPEGDERAVHPDKIYAYARAAYDYWAERLEVDGEPWPDGFFGENLTFDELDEDDLRVGDVFALGAEVRLVVAGPRNPCLKLSWRLGQPLAFQKTFARSHHTGVYFGVLSPGTVRPGDTAVRIHRAESMPSVAEVASYTIGHQIPPLVPLQRLLDCEHLSGTIRFILLAKLDAARRAAATKDGRWRGWRSFTIDRIVAETDYVRSVYLQASDGKPICQPRAGQFVTVRPDRGQRDDFTRCWSVSAFSHEMQQYRLSVLRQKGSGSQWLHGLEVGDTVKLRAPAGQFVLDMGGFRPVVLVAAGIGITPLLAMLHAHLTRGADAAPVYLIYSARRPSDVAFRAEIDALAKQYSSLHVTYVYSRVDTVDHAAARITAELLISVLTDLHIVLAGLRVPLPWFESDTYICGPGDFCKRLKQDLVARGANADHVSYELFIPPIADVSELETAEVHFARSQKTCTWTAEQDLSLLELAEQAGAAAPSDCRAGACLTCKTAVLEGEATVSTDDGSALLCIGRPKTNRMVLDC